MHPLARILSVKLLYRYNLLFWLTLCLLQLIQTLSLTLSFDQAFLWIHVIRYPIATCLSYWILSHLVFDLYLTTRKIHLHVFIIFHMSASLGFGFVHKLLAYTSGLLLERLFLEQETKTWRELIQLWQQTWFDVVNPIAVYWMILGILLALDYWHRFRDQALRSHVLQHQLTEAQLQHLKMQMQPHFLFNALNTIAMMVRRHQDKPALDMLTGLSEMLRNNMSKKKKQLITLEEELTLVNHYLSIEKVRYQDRLHLEINIQEDTRQMLVPNLILQPIVENAFKHGVAHALDKSLVRIAAYYEQDQLVLEVFNSIDDSSQDWILAKSRGIGLGNTIERLLQLYRGKAKFQINEKEEGVLVRITLPAHSADTSRVLNLRED